MVLYPVVGPVSQVFGAHPEFEWQKGYGHLGLDQGVTIGTPVMAIADGTVLWANWSSQMPVAMANANMFIPGAPGGGITVIIQHDGYRAIYAHLNATHLNIGDRVKRNQRVGDSGNTGNSTGPHHHFEVYTFPSSNVPRYSRYNPVPQLEHEDRIAGASAPAPVIINPQERITVGAGAVQRDKPSTATDSKIVRTIQGNTKEKFTGYVIGQEVVREASQALPRVVSNIWYVDNGDDGKGAARYSSAIGYTEQRISGLPNLTPAAARPANRRLSVRAGAIMRDAPNTSGKVLRGIAGGTTEDFTHWVVGEEVFRAGITGVQHEMRTNIWYKDSEGYVSAVGFFETNYKDGLVEYKLPASVSPAPKPVPYSFVKDVSCVTAVRPADWSNFGVGGMAPFTKQTKIILHQFNGANPKDDPVTNWDTVHIGSVRNAFTQKGGRIASAHFGVEKTEVDQYVSLKDRAYHAGAEGNDFWSIEIYGGMDDITRASVVKLIRELNALAGRTLELESHRGILGGGGTLCGSNVDLQWFRDAVTPPVIAPAPAPAPAPTPAPAPKPAPETPGPDHRANEKNVLTAFFSWLTDMFLNRKR